MASRTTGRSYTDKLARNASVLSTLYVLPMAAQAAVVHVTSPLSISIDDYRTVNYQPVDWDVDGDSVADFKLEAFRTIFYTGGYSTGYGSGGYSLSRPYGSLQLNSNGLNGQGMVQESGATASDIAGLIAGDIVGPTLSGRQWGPQANRQLMISSDYAAFGTTSLYGDGNLIGFSFLEAGGQTLYGWASLSLNERFHSMTIDEWAYEDNGGSIQVGQISAVPVPPSALLMLSGLALGAGGVLRGRKLRAAATQKQTDTNL